MKKLLGSSLALAMLVGFGGQANAELLKNFKLGGQIDVQATSANNSTDFQTYGSPRNIPAATNRDRIGDAQTRVMLHMDWDLADDVHSKITLAKNNRTYGTGSEDLNDVQNNLQIEQANIKLDKLAGMADLTLGRQFFGQSGDIVIYYGPSDKPQYGLPVTAVDGGRFDWSSDMIGITGLVAKTVGTALATAATVPQGGTDVHGLNVAWKGTDMVNAGAYIWRQVTHRVTAAEGVNAGNGVAGGRNDQLYVMGLKGKATMGGAWLAAELAKNMGDNRQVGDANGVPAARSYVGWAGKVDAGYKMDMGGLGAVGAWAHMGIGSGDGSPRDNKNNAFTAISPDYRPGAFNGRFAGTGVGLGSNLPQGVGTFGTASLSNRQNIGFGVKVTPEAVNKLTVGLSYWDFSFATPQGNAATAGGGHSHIGSEIDVDLTWMHNENVGVSLGAARFAPGGYIREVVQPLSASNANAGNGRGVNHAYLGYFDVKVKFGGS